VRFDDKIAGPKTSSESASVEQDMAIELND